MEARIIAACGEVQWRVAGLAYVAAASNCRRASDETGNSKIEIGHSKFVRNIIGDPPYFVPIRKMDLIVNRGVATISIS
jgi:hypothetical protein